MLKCSNWCSNPCKRIPDQVLSALINVIFRCLILFCYYKLLFLLVRGNIQIFWDRNFGFSKAICHNQQYWNNKRLSIFQLMCNESRMYEILVVLITLREIQNFTQYSNFLRSTCIYIYISYFSHYRAHQIVFLLESQAYMKLNTLHLDICWPTVWMSLEGILL